LLLIDPSVHLLSAHLFLSRLPPPPASHPLSLHDALPISRCGPRGSRSAWSSRSSTSTACCEPPSCGRYTPTIPRNSAARSRPCSDRKSTRLNSSHGSISYGVLGLKKKTRSSRACCCCYLS